MEGDIRKEKPHSSRNGRRKKKDPAAQGEGSSKERDASQGRQSFARRRTFRAGEAKRKRLLRGRSKHDAAVEGAVGHVRKEAAGGEGNRRSSRRAEEGAERKGQKIKQESF